MPKTVKQWANSLPQKYRKLFISTNAAWIKCKPSDSSAQGVYGTLSACIMDAFAWDNSSWNSLYAEAQRQERTQGFKGKYSWKNWTAPK